MTDDLVYRVIAVIVAINVGVLIWALCIDVRESRKARRLARLQRDQQRQYEEASRG